MKQANVSTIVGIDEVGRGCIAGPLTVSAYVTKIDTFVDGVNDSKLLSSKKRNNIYSALKNGLFYVYHTPVSIIDKINIYQATLHTMKKLLLDLDIEPSETVVLVDAMPITIKGYNIQSIIRGDQTSYAIACASIVAKVNRDLLMCEYHELYPEYGFNNHKGYGTSQHRENVSKYGRKEDVHRKSFKIQYEGVVL